MTHEKSGHLTTRQRILFVLGSPGWQITGTMVVSIGIYFYLPPEGAGLPVLVSEEIFLGVLTAYGLARLLGGIVDSLADPVVGHYCDRSTSRFGRRRLFMIAGIVPMCLVPGLLFFPPGDPGSFDTFIYLTIMLSLYYIFFTVYVAPYLALIPEIAVTERDRVNLSRLRAMVGGPIIMAYGVLWLAGIDFFKSLGFEATTSVQLVVVISCIFAFLCSVCPILVVDESKMSPVPSTLKMREALVVTLQNRPFIIYLFAQIIFIMGVTMSGPSLPYIARVLLGRDEGFAATLSVAMLPGILFSFAFIHLLVARFGTRNTLVMSIIVLGFALVPYGLINPSVPDGPGDDFNVVLVLVLASIKGLAIPAFMILPTVILGQLIDLDSAHTHANRAAMYYGVQGLLTKWVYAASAALMSFLLSAYGRSASEPLGVQLIGPVAGAFCFVSAFFYWLYPEKSVQAEAAAAMEAKPGSALAAG